VSFPKVLARDKWGKNKIKAYKRRRHTHSSQQNKGVSWAIYLDNLIYTLHFATKQLKTAGERLFLGQRALLTLLSGIGKTN